MSKLILCFLLITSYVFTFDVNRTLYPFDYDMYQVSCGTNDNNGCSYTLSVLSNSEHETVNIYSMDIDNFKDYINSNGKHFSYYVNESKRNVHNYTKSANISNNAIIVIIECDPIPYYTYNVDDALVYRHYPNCNYFLNSQADNIESVSEYNDYMAVYSVAQSIKINHVVLSLVLVYWMLC